MGSDLLTVVNSDEEGLVLRTIASIPMFGQPIIPGYYHLGLYQRQSARQVYQRNGLRV